MRNRKLLAISIVIALVTVSAVAYAGIFNNAFLINAVQNVAYSVQYSASKIAHSIESITSSLQNISSSVDFVAVSILILPVLLFVMCGILLFVYIKAKYDMLETYIKFLKKYGKLREASRVLEEV